MPPVRRTVRYTALINGPLVVGVRAIVIPLNHPDRESVQNGEPCITTPVNIVYPDGTTFDTHNSHYVFEDLSTTDTGVIDQNRVVLLEDFRA